MTLKNTANVVAFAPLQSKARYAGLAEMEAYWQALRRGRPVPLRSDIDPRGIEQSLDFAFIVERVAPGVARFRLAGTQLNELMGMSVQGMPMTTFFTPSTRNTMQDAIEEVFAGPATVEAQLQSEPSIGKPKIEAQMLLLPLRSDLGDITRAVGCLATRGKIGRAPRRFALTAAPQIRRIATPEQFPHGKSREEAFAERRTAFTGVRPSDANAPQPHAHPSERPYLRVISEED